MAKRNLRCDIMAAVMAKYASQLVYAWLEAKQAGNEEAAQKLLSQSARCTELSREFSNAG